MSDVFPLNKLPVTVLSCVVEQLNFENACSLRLVSNKFKEAELMARHKRKRLSGTLLRRLFPRRQYSSARAACGYGLLALAIQFKRLLHVTPPGALRIVDLSKVSSIGDSHLLDIIQSLNAEALFRNVTKLIVGCCVIDNNELGALSELMPDVWSIRIDPKFVMLDGNDNEVTDLNNTEKKRLHRIVANHGVCSPRFSRASKNVDHPPRLRGRMLNVTALLVHLFPKLESLHMN